MAKENRTRQDVVGDTVLDLGKMTFAGIVLAGIFDSSLNKLIVVLGGLLFCLHFAQHTCTVLLLIGIYLTTKK